MWVLECLDLGFGELRSEHVFEYGGSSDGFLFSVFLVWMVCGSVEEDDGFSVEVEGETDVDF